MPDCLDIDTDSDTDAQDDAGDTVDTRPSIERPITLSQAYESIGARYAHRSMRFFTRFVVPSYRMQWYHRQICDALDEFLKGHIKRLMIFTPPQHGKFLPYDTPILTTRGWKNHGQLERGDYVFGHDGKPKMVVATSGIYSWPVVEMKFQTGESITCAKEHMWKVSVDYDDHKGRRDEVLEAQKIFSHRNRRSPAIKIAPPLVMPEADLPIDPYLFGVWLGDGNSANSYITCGKQDLGHFSALGQYKEVKPGIYRIKPDGLQKKLRLNKLLYNKHIPEQYLLSSIEQRRSLLAGLMDTDGCCDTRGRCEFCQMAGRLAEDVYTLIRS